jgi:gluconokinase
MLMGVAGSGKTTIGRLLAVELGWQFKDADDFHPPANIRKMSAGIPLDDADRAPWLQAIRTHVLTCLHNAECAIVTCSGLKKVYRDMIVPDPSRVKLVYLKGSRDLLLSRLSARESHFMKPQMLESQLATLEEPQDALTVDVSSAPAEIAAAIRKAFSI